MNALIQDLRLAARSLLRSPGFTLAAVLTVGLGAGATTTVFTVVNALILRPPVGIVEPHRVVDVWGAAEAGRHSWMVHSFPSYLDYRDHSTSFDGLAAHGLQPVSLSTGEMAERVFALTVSTNYFEVLGTRAGRGRTFFEGDETTIVLSHEYWQRRFASDPAVVGQTVFVSGQPLTVIGVAEPGFAGTLRGLGVEAWIPLTLVPTLTGRTSKLAENSHWLQMTGRLAPGVTQDRANAELNAIADQFAGREGGASRPTAVSLTRAGSLAGEARDGVVGVGAAFVILAILVLVIASVNVGGMLLARTSARRRDLAIRIALGAGRGRVVRHLLAESSIIFLMGGALGFLVSVWTARLLLSIPLPAAIPVRLDLSPDWRVFGFALLVAGVAGLLFGSSPALRASGRNVAPSLRGGAAGPTRGDSRLRSTYVVVQVVVSLLLLVTAGLFLRTLQQAHAVELGFEPLGVFAATLDLGIQGYPDDRHTVTYRQVIDRAAALPGVEHAGFVWLLPLGLATATTSAEIGSERVHLPYNRVGPDYFRTVGIPLLGGREFTYGDDPESSPVAMVNRELVERYWPHGSGIGETIRFGGRDLEVIGVVENSKHSSLSEPAAPFLYLPVFQREGNPELTLLLRTRGNPTSLLPFLRQAVDEVDAHLPLLDPGPLTDRIGGAILLHRLAAAFAGMLGLLGTALACIGLYGTLAYLVTLRTREIGMRLALGASENGIGRMVMWRGFRLVGIGVTIGLVVATVATRPLAGLLLDVDPIDPVTYIGMAALLAFVALAACYVPARRASRVDPMVALRAD